MGCLPTGMPRPLSELVMVPSLWMVTRTSVAVTGHGLVDGVVDDFVDEVVEAALVGAADVHAGATADGLEAFEDLDIGGGVAFRLLL